MITEVTRELIGSHRTIIRNEVVGWFLEEAPGTGKLDLSSIYRYKVESLSGDSQVLLRRPARLNKGFDFTVAIPGAIFESRTRDTPRHQNIINDLLLKRAADTVQFRLAMGLIDRTFLCEVIDDEEILAVRFEQVGYPFDHILKVIKWLFIEQDVTYWNWSGRAMFYNAITSAIGRP